MNSCLELRSCIPDFGAFDQLLDFGEHVHQVNHGPLLQRADIIVQVLNELNDQFLGHLALVVRLELGDFHQAFQDLDPDTHIDVADVDLVFVAEDFDNLSLGLGSPVRDVWLLGDFLQDPEKR